MINDWPQNWSFLPIEDAVATIIDYRGKSPRKTSVGIPLVTAKIVKNGRIATPQEFIAPEDYDAWMRRGLPESGDVVMTTEAPLGEVAQLSGDKIALAQRLITLRGKPELIDNMYLRYVMQSVFVQDQLRSRATGTTVVGIRQSELRKVEIPVPPIAEQRAIADILGTLNDKIELNRRMNQTLEAMARALFKNWFIDFDPVRAKIAPESGNPPHGLDPATANLFPDAFHDSPLGPIPQGWSAGTLSEVADNPRRSIKSEQIDPTSAYIALDHMPRRSISLTDWDTAKSITSGKYQFNRGNILFGKLRPYFHKVGVAPVDGVCSTDILVVVPKDDNWFGFALGHISSDEFISYTDAGSTGTKMPRTNWDYMSRYDVAVPDVAVARVYTEQVNPFVERIHANIYENRTLAVTRDALLPKLLSGELRVGEAERLVGEVA